MIFNIREVKRLSNIDNRNSIERKMMKITEETGELSSILLAYVDADNTSGSHKNLTKEEIKSNVIEESCDVINSTMNLIFNLFEDKEIQEMFDKKLKKWESKLK